MKKNTFMRLAMALVLLVLVTTSAVGGTFAKYVTKGSATDTARVAKFGVEVSANKSTLVVTEVDGKTEDHVLISKVDRVILAPGTQAEKLADITLTGDPEVAVNISYAAVLKLENWTVDGSFYCPLQITVNGTPLKGTDYTTAGEFEAAVEKAIADLSDDYAESYDITSVEGPQVTVTWEFEGTTGTKYNQSDVKDTVLGDAAYDGNAATVSLTVTATVTQFN